MWYVHVNRDGELVAWGALSHGKNRTGRDLSEAGGAMWDVLSVPGAGKMVVVGCEMARRKRRNGASEASEWLDSSVVFLGWMVSCWSGKRRFVSLVGTCCEVICACRSVPVLGGFGVHRFVGRGLNGRFLGGVVSDWRVSVRRQ
jgi:hypothetical protein